MDASKEREDLAEPELEQSEFPNKTSSRNSTGAEGQASETETATEVEQIDEAEEGVEGTEEQAKEETEGENEKQGTHEEDGEEATEQVEEETKMEDGEEPQEEAEAEGTVQKKRKRKSSASEENGEGKDEVMNSKQSSSGKQQRKKKPVTRKRKAEEEEGEEEQEEGYEERVGDELGVEEIDDDDKSDGDTELSAFGLQTKEMSLLEQLMLPQFKKKENIYFSIRSRILEKWSRNINTFLTETEATNGLRVSKEVSSRVYQFLDQFGFINHGIVERPSRASIFDNANSSKSSNGRNGSGKKTVVVVGAGIGGLCTAKQLSGFGYHVIVVEAKSQIGGRMLSDSQNIENASVDLGVNLISLEANPLTVMLRQLAREVSHTSHNDDEQDLPDSLVYYLERDSQLYDELGTLLDAEEKEQSENTHHKILKGVEELRQRSSQLQEGTKGEHDKNKSQASSSSSSSLLNDQSSDAIDVETARQQVIEDLEVNLNSHERRIINWHVGELEYEYGTSLDNISLAHFNERKKPGRSCMLRAGVGSLISRLAHGLDVRTQHVVKWIDYTKPQCRIGVTRLLSSEESSSSSTITQDEVLIADAVVVAVPLGVLKANVISFEPVLPVRKLTAISHLGCGLVNKLILEFDRIFWDESSETFAQLDDNAMFHCFHPLNRVYGGKAILAAQIVGKAAEKFETKSLEECTADCMTVLRRVFGVDIPQPLNAIQTKWKEDEFARGTGCFLPPGSSLKDCEALAKSLDKRLFFCGGATNPSLGGAFLSGLRCAGEVHNADHVWPDFKVEEGDDFAVMSVEDLRVTQTDRKSKLERTSSLLDKLRREIDHTREQKRLKEVEGADASLESDELRSLQQKYVDIQSREAQLAAEVGQLDAALRRLKQKRKQTPRRAPLPTVASKDEEVSVVVVASAEELQSHVSQLLQGAVLVGALPEKEQSSEKTKQLGPDMKPQAFTAKLPDYAGLPELLPFSEEPIRDVTPNTRASSQRSGSKQHYKSSRHSHPVSDSRSKLEHPKAQHQTRSHRESSHSGAHVKSQHHKNFSSKQPSKTTSKPANDDKVAHAIRAHVTKLVDSEPTAKDKKTISEKTFGKVYQDWSSKSRPVHVDEWLSGKRTSSIVELIRKYAQKIR